MAQTNRTCYYTSWPSSATPQPNTTASIGGVVTKFGKSVQWLPTEDDCRVNDFVTLLVLLLTVLLDGFNPGFGETSACWSSAACTISVQLFRCAV